MSNTLTLSFINENYCWKNYCWNPRWRLLLTLRLWEHRQIFMTSCPALRRLELIDNGFLFTVEVQSSWSKWFWEFVTICWVGHSKIIHNKLHSLQVMLKWIECKLKSLPLVFILALKIALYTSAEFPVTVERLGIRLNEISQQLLFTK